MRSKFVALVKRFLNWLDQESLHVIVPKDDLFHKAADLIVSQDLFPISGEAKRHQVYARLLKDFPLVPKRSIAFVIEAVLSTL